MCQRSLRAVTCFFLGEYNEQRTGLFEYEWNYDRIVGMIASCSVSVLVNYSGFAVMGRVGALNHVVLGQLKSVCIVAWGMFVLQDTSMTPDRLIGCLLGFTAICGYTNRTMSEDTQEVRRRKA